MSGIEYVLHSCGGIVSLSAPNGRVKSSRSSTKFPRSSAKPPRSSAISFECHDAFFFEELSKSLESDLREEKDSSMKDCETEDKDVIEDNFERDSEHPSDFFPTSSTKSEPTKDIHSIIDDPNVSIVKKFEARIIDREVRAGSRLFRSLCEASFASSSIAGKVACLASKPAQQLLRTLSDAASASSSMLQEVARASSSLASIAGRVTLSASGAFLSSSHINGLRKKSSMARHNETFSSSKFWGKNNAGVIEKDGIASAAGHALLRDDDYQRSKDYSMKRASGRSKVASGLARSSSSMTSNIKENLSSANFMRLLNNDAQELLK